MKFPTSPYIQQNLVGHNPNLQQTFTIFFFHATNNHQPPPMQPLEDSVPGTQPGGIRRGKGKCKGKEKVVAESEEPPLWWTLYEECVLAAT